MLTEQFTEEFKEQFSQEGFYAVPNKTKIYFYFNGQQELVGNAVIANLEQVNEKIPVYSYNSPLFNKHLNGKQVVTGVIALRKITVAQFISMITTKTNTQKLNKEIEELISEMERLKKLKELNVQKNFVGLNKIIASKKATVEKIQKLLKNKNITNEQMYEMGNYSNVQAEDFSNDDLLYYIDKNNNDINKLKITINFEGVLGKDVSPFISIKDVLFTRKRTEINVSRGDIIEVYDFIGNPDNKRGV